MTTHTLDVGERRLVWWPFWGLPTGVTPDMRIGTGQWLSLTEDQTFVPDVPPEKPNPKWYRALLAHPACTGNPTGTVVVPLGTSRLRHRVTGNPEIEIPDPGEYVTAL